MRPKLSDAQIDEALKRLQERGVAVTWRALQAELQRQYGVVGRTDRLRRACRLLKQARGAPEPAASLPLPLVPGLPPESLQQRLETALAERDRALERAERAEQREMTHQDRWALEIHSLRETVARLRREQSERQRLEDQLLRLQQELHGLYARLDRRH